MAQVGTDGSFLLINPAFARLTGYSRAELLAGGFQQITHPDDLGTDIAHVEQLLAGEADDYSMEKRYIRKDGRSVWINLTVSLVRDRHGRPDFFVAVAEKIDDRKEAEAELEAREAQLRTIVETVPVGLVMADLPSGRIVSGNSYVEQMLRHPVLYSSDVHSYDEWVSFHEDGQRVQGEEYPLARMVLAGEEEPSIDVNYRRGDGTYRWTRIFGRPVRNEASEVIGGVVALLDIEEERSARESIANQLHSLQSQLIHTSRVSAMGTMASSIAHELNQPLAALSNYMGGMRKLLERPQPFDREELLAVTRAAESCSLRAGEIIRGLRQMLTQSDAKCLPCNVSKLVEGATSIALIGLGSTGITYGQDVSLSLWVDADALQIQQVLINLIRNAIDALDGANGGQVHLTAREAEGFVHIKVTDTGTGVSEDVRQKLFEPFVSTKSHGMGIGLSICRTIVEAHGGKIWFDEGGQGASVTFTLRKAKPPKSDRTSRK